MQLGIMTRTFVRPSLEETLDAVKSYGLSCVQFSLSSAGIANLPDRIEPELSGRIRQALAVRDLSMAAISGTFNMIHPDPQERESGLRRLEVLAAACEWMGTSLITLCTGTRDPDNMWRRHPANDSPEAWRDLVVSMAEAVRLAELYGVTLGVEPEVSNVVDSAAKARRLLDELRSPRLKIIMDGANLFHTGELPHMREILTEAFDLLGEDIVLAHAKDLSQDGAAGQEAAGTGLLDYDHYLALLRRAGFTGGLILHSLSEAQVANSVQFLRNKLS